MLTKASILSFHTISHKEYKSKKYSVMYYKNSKQIGIRRKTGKTDTAFSFGNLSCGLDELSLRGFADQVLKKLDEGESERAVHDWVWAAIEA